MKSKETLVHIRIGKEIREQIQDLINSGLFSNQAEAVREGIREILLKYKKLKNE